MKKIEDIKKDFHQETSLRVAMPLVNVAKSWLFLEDIGNDERATELNFGALSGNELYMTNAEKNTSGYAKLYIVAPHHTMIWSLYVEKRILCPGESYHHVTRT